jgi:hypothetical protein
MQFNGNDSRFRSAEQSPETEQFSFISRDDLGNDHHHDRYSAVGEDSYEASIADSNRNSIHYDSDELHEMAEPEARSTVEDGALAPLASFPNPPSLNTAGGVMLERYMQGPGRPISVGNGLHKKKSFAASQHYESEPGNDMEISNNLSGAFL